MASPVVVQRALQAFANNYGKTDRWIEDTHKLWSRGLADIHDKDLVRGVEDWCRNRSRPPNLARLRELIDSNPTTFTPAQLEGCPACDTTGWREVCRWYEEDGVTRTRSVVAACDCPKGERFVSSSVVSWRQLVDQWQRHPYTDAVYYSTAKQPHLTTAQRLTPEQLAELEARAKVGPTKVSGWSQIAEKQS